LSKRDVCLGIVEDEENRKRMVAPIFSMARLAVKYIALAELAEVGRA
jgi:hypothetical protein